MNLDLNGPKLRFVVDGCVQETSPSYEINTPELVKKYWNEHIKSDPTVEEHKEHLIVIIVNTNLKVIGYTVVSTGTVDKCLACVRNILQPVLISGAKSFLLLHNHPSGKTCPSSADRLTTLKVKEAAELMERLFQAFLT